MAQPFSAFPPPDDLWPDAPVDYLAELEALAWDGVQPLTELIAEGRDDRWRIGDDSAAEWAMGKLAEARSQRAVLDQQRDEYVARARQWHERVTVGPDRQAAFFEAHLMDYAWRRRSESAGESMTVKLPSGEIATRKAPEPRVDIVDQKAVCEWARRWVPDAVTTTHKVNVTDLRPHVRIDDETVVADILDFDTAEVQTVDVPGVAVVDGEPWAKPKPYEIS